MWLLKNRLSTTEMFPADIFILGFWKFRLLISLSVIDSSTLLMAAVLLKTSAHGGFRVQNIWTFGTTNCAQPDTKIHTEKKNLAPVMCKKKKKCRINPCVSSMSAWQITVCAIAKLFYNNSQCSSYHTIKQRWEIVALLVIALGGGRGWGAIG